jgi:anaerobic selenocysteine-containing dehydrogenase
MKRTNPDKGPGVDPKWQEISWDEAYNIVADKLKKIRAENPNKFMYTYGWGGGYSSGMAPFHTIFGSINGMSGFGGMICGAGMHTASYLMHGASSHTGDTDYQMYNIRGGASQGVNKAGVPETKDFVRARERGMKFVAVDPRLSEEAAKADEWVPIRPGSDRLMHLAMMNILLNELKIYDAEFIKRRTNGPYLIQPDGYYLRSKTDLVDDPIRKQKLGKPLVWDAKAKQAKVFDDPSVIQNWNDLALEGELEVEGTKVKPAFQIFKDHVKQFTPEMTEKVTTVPAATMRRLSKELAEAAQIGSSITINGTVFPYRPVGSRWRGGRTHQHAAWDSLSNILLFMLLGALDVPGGLIAEGADLTPNPADGITAPKGSARYRFKWPPDAYMQDTWRPISYKNISLAYSAILDPKKYGLEYPVEALMIHGCNPLMGGGSVNKMVDAFKKIPFIFTIS